LEDTLLIIPAYYYTNITGSQLVIYHYEEITSSTIDV